MKLNPLSEDARRERMPLPPCELFCAKHDVIHRNRSAKARPANVRRAAK